MSHWLKTRTLEPRNLLALINASHLRELAVACLVFILKSFVICLYVHTFGSADEVRGYEGMRGGGEPGFFDSAYV